MHLKHYFLLILQLLYEIFLHVFDVLYVYYFILAFPSSIIVTLYSIYWYQTWNYIILFFTKAVYKW